MDAWAMIALLVDIPFAVYLVKVLRDVHKLNKWLKSFAEKNPDYTDAE